VNATVRIGMEVHLQLRTRSKMFCRCASAPSAPDAPPNTNVCPVCLGMPGTLPVPNREAFTLGLTLAAAVGAESPATTWFERKHYFYPDLPRGYQISQLTRPLATGGAIAIHTPDGTKRIALRRLHLEEDSGRSAHDDAQGGSAIDFNRAGTPLIEIVTEPELSSPAEALGWIDALREIVLYLGISDARLEDGQMRCEPNVDLRVVLGDRAVHTPVSEIKNLNSRRHVEQALEAEIARQRALVAERGEEVEWLPRATLGWSEGRRRLFVMRTKEEAPDYRYLPEPDIPPITLDAAWRSAAAAAVPELPAPRRLRLSRDLGLDAAQAERLCRDRQTADWFESCVRAGAPPGAAAGWVLGELAHVAGERGLPVHGLGLAPSTLASLAELVARGVVGRGPAAGRVLPLLLDGEEDPAQVVERLGLASIVDEEALRRAAREALDGQPEAVAALRAGKPRALEALVGAAMRATGGKANPLRLRDVVRTMVEEKR